MSDEVVLHPHDPAWIARFAAEQARLLVACGSRLVAVEHFGSTAVPGIDSKPVIDLLAGVRSMADADALILPLSQVGWDSSPEFNATLTDRRFLLRRSDGIRTHHLHLVVYGSAAWLQPLRFRDLLRADPDLAHRYQVLKHALATLHRHDREAYTAAKGEFIEQVIAADASFAGS